MSTLLGSSRLWTFYDKVLLYLVLAFFAAHMLNHLVLVAGQNTHLAVMDQLRAIYRFPVVELLLVWAIIRQIMAGMRQTRRFGPIKSKGRFRVLVWSGLYLIFFLAIHMNAVALGRYALGLDTNLYFGAAGYHLWPYMLWFYPYYFLAILASFAHLGAVVWLRHRATSPGFADQFYRLSLIGGLAAALLISLAMGGVLSDIAVPASYLQTFP